MLIMLAMIAAYVVVMGGLLIAILSERKNRSIQHANKGSQFKAPTGIRRERIQN